MYRNASSALEKDNTYNERNIIGLTHDKKAWPSHVTTHFPEKEVNGKKIREKIHNPRFGVWNLYWKDPKKHNYDYAAHEAGHLALLDENYTKNPKTGKNEPNKGAEGYLMAKTTGSLSEWEFGEVMRLNNIVCPCGKADSEHPSTPKKKFHINRLLK